jgi:hypothetical protein
MVLINNRNINRSFLIVSFLLLNLLLLMGISNVLAYLNSGASRSTMLHLEKETIHTYLPEVSWQTPNNPGRIMEAYTLKRIEKDYLFSWYIKNRAFQTNTKEGIEDYYTQNTRQNLYHALAYNSKKGITIESTTLQHHPELNFYSADGQLVVFTDKNVIEFQKIYQNKKQIASVQDTASYKVMMLLEDGFWRLRHMQKLPKVVLVSDTLQSNPVFRVQGDKILKYNQVYTIKGINYYPQKSAWDTFGAGFNLQTISKDFDLIKKSNLHSIRIFIPYEDFGKADIQSEKLAKLKKMLDLAEAKKLDVIVSLFDFYSDYTLESWTLTQRHAEKIVTTFKNHKAILAWDIKNEPDLDFEKRDKFNVLSWLEQMSTLIHEKDPNHLVTIGWSNSKAATNLNSKVDLVSYHFYNAINDLEKEHTTLANACKKPILIEEFGIPSYSGIWNFWNGSADSQAEYHKKMQTLFRKNGFAFMSWTLYDFPEVPDQVAGKWPWQKLRQKTFGFLDENGNKKPSFQFITN